ncbi:hypothetical protein [Algoriphagus winogradskyi]|uniref:hypothetical protein n=1 Tax=Algoriphagus winogradskyi TaxID=237017 RepID=UPI0024B690FE|nr:hypothetical protein [Algoriphagus winogradskyi]
MKSSCWLKVVGILLFWLMPSKNFAQQIPRLDKNILIKASPMALLEPETVVVQGGIEYFLSPKLSIQSEIGLNGGFIGISSGRGKNEQFSMWRTKNELKLYSAKNYWGLNYFLSKRTSIVQMITTILQIPKLGMIKHTLTFRCWAPD